MLFLFFYPLGKIKIQLYDGKRAFWACGRLNKHSYVLLTL